MIVFFFTLESKDDIANDETLKSNDFIAEDDLGTSGSFSATVAKVTECRRGVFFIDTDNGAKPTPRKS